MIGKMTFEKSGVKGKRLPIPYGRMGMKRDA